MPDCIQKASIIFIFDLDQDEDDDNKDMDIITRIKGILGYTIFIGLEFAIVGYFFIYRLYLDR